MIIKPFDVSNFNKKSIFLAGGMGKTNWRERIIKNIETNYDIINPTNNDYNDKILKKQCLWELEYIKRCDIILFWFPSDTPGSISLFELGYSIGISKNIIMGIDDNYQYKNDLLNRVKLLYNNTIIFNKLDDIINTL